MNLPSLDTTTQLTLFTAFIVATRPPSFTRHTWIPFKPPLTRYCCTKDHLTIIITSPASRSMLEPRHGATTRLSRSNQCTRGGILTTISSARPMQRMREAQCPQDVKRWGATHGNLACHLFRLSHAFGTSRISAKCNNTVNQVTVSIVTSDVCTSIQCVILLDRHTVT